MLEIVHEIHRCKERNLKGVLATIISVSGSTYQKEGAKCFLSEDGKLTGLLSGGCVESDITEHGYEVMLNGQPKRIYYDFRNEGDSIWGLGLGCNGAMEIFLELYDPMMEEHSAKIERMFTNKKPTWVATITKSNAAYPIGEKHIANNANEFEGLGKLFSIFKTEDSNELLPTKPQLMKITEADQEVEVFIDYLEPIPTLAIFGAGPDAVPVVTAAKSIGWMVKVMDHRPAYLTEENFPLADELCLIKPGQIPDVLLDENSFTIIMSHHFLQDQLALEGLLFSNTSYIGILGPQTRTTALLEPILAKYPNENLQLSRIYSPIGLNINAKTPGEIAQSIVSELIAVYRKSVDINKLKKSKNIANVNRKEYAYLS